MALVDELLSDVNLDLPPPSSSSSQQDTASCEDTVLTSTSITASCVVDRDPITDVCVDSVLSSVPITDVCVETVLHSDPITTPCESNTEISDVCGDSVLYDAAANASCEDDTRISDVCGDSVLYDAAITTSCGDGDQIADVCGDAVLHSVPITVSCGGSNQVEDVCADTVLNTAPIADVCQAAGLSDYPDDEDLVLNTDQIPSVEEVTELVSDHIDSAGAAPALESDRVGSSGIESILDNERIGDVNVNEATGMVKRLGYTTLPSTNPCSITDCLQQRFGSLLKRKRRRKLAASTCGVVTQDSAATSNAPLPKYNKPQGAEREIQQPDDSCDVDDELYGFRRELELRRQIAKLRQRCVNEQLTLRSVRRSRDVVLHQLQPPSTAVASRQARHDRHFNQMQVESGEPSGEHMPYMMALRCEDDDAMGMGQTANDEHLNVEQCDSWLYTSDSCAGSGVRRIARQLRQYRLRCLSLRCQLLRRSLHETRLRSRLIQCESRRASSEITWRRRLAMLFTDGQMNSLRERWRGAGLIDTDSAWEWLPRSSSGTANTGGTWALQDYRATIELRAHCTARGFNYLLNTLGYPLPSMFATRSAAHCNKYPQVASLYRQLCAHKQVSFDRSTGASLETELAEEYDAEVAMRFRQLQKEEEMAVLQDEVTRAVDTVDSSALAGVIQWGRAVTSTTHPPPPSPPPERLLAWLPPSTTSTIDPISSSGHTNHTVPDYSFCSDDKEEQERPQLEDAATGDDMDHVEEHMVGVRSSTLNAVHDTKAGGVERQSLLHFSDSSHRLNHKWL